MSVKKAYGPLIEFLKTNLDKKVRTILDEVIEMCSAKSAGSSATTVHRDEAGEIVFIRCGYFKQWLPTAYVEFGPKASSASGFNPMCKDGNNLWYRQQREAKNAKEQLLTDVASGAVEAQDVAGRLEAIEQARLFVETHPMGFATLEEALAAPPEDLEELAQAAMKEVEELVPVAS